MAAPVLRHRRGAEPDRHLYDAAAPARHMYRWTKSWSLPWMRPVWTAWGPALAARYFGTTGRPAVLRGAKTIVLATPLDAPQSNLAQPFLQKIRGLLRTAPPEAAVLKEQVGRALDEADAALDADARLAISLRNAGNVLLPTQLLAPSGAAAGDAPCLPMSTAVPCPIWARVLCCPPVQVPSRWRCSGRQLQASGTCRPGPRGGWHRSPGTLALGSRWCSGAPLALLTAMHSLHLGRRRSNRWTAMPCVWGLLLPSGSPALLRPQIYRNQDGAPPFPGVFFSGCAPGQGSSGAMAGQDCSGWCHGAPHPTLLRVPGGGQLTPVELRRTKRPASGRGTSIPNRPGVGP